MLEEIGETGKRRRPLSLEFSKNPWRWTKKNGNQCIPFLELELSAVFLTGIGL